MASPADPLNGALQPAAQPVQWQLKDHTTGRLEKLRKLHNNPRYSDVTMGLFFGQFTIREGRGVLGERAKTIIHI